MGKRWSQHLFFDFIDSFVHPQFCESIGHKCREGVLKLFYLLHFCLTITKIKAALTSTHPYLVIVPQSSG